MWAQKMKSAPVDVKDDYVKKGTKSKCIILKCDN